MTSRDIQRALMVERYRRSFVLHNYTPKDWWECDVFEVTDAGYFREYEIKLSIGDFKADSGKAKYGWEYDHLTRKVVTPKIGTKHEMLANGDERGPSAFSFVIPDGLIPAESIPPWAGLITVKEWASHKPPWNARLTIVRNPPRLHDKKLSDEIANHARGICYYRMHNMFNFGKTCSPIDAPDLTAPQVPEALRGSG